MLARVIVLIAGLALTAAAPLQAALPLPAPETAEPAEPDAPIELTSPDQQIAARLREVYRAIDGLQGIRVAVQGGVVSLSGTTLDDAALGPSRIGCK